MRDRNCMADRKPSVCQINENVVSMPLPDTGRQLFLGDAVAVVNTYLVDTDINILVDKLSPASEMENGAIERCSRKFANTAQLS